MTINQLGNQCLNDFSVTGLTAGATRSLFVQNLNNFAGSAARILSQVGGEASSDAVYQAAIQAGQFWSWGLDNSNSNKFVLSGSAALGTTDVMQVYPAGQINYPLQPMMRAYRAAGTAAVTGDNTLYQVVFDTENFDVGGCYSTVTGVYTVPVDGVYLINTMVSVDGLQATHVIAGFHINVAGNLVTLAQTNPYASAYAFGGSVRNIFLTSTTYRCVAGNTIDVNVRIGGNPKSVTVCGSAECDTYFCVNLLG